MLIKISPLKSHQNNIRGRKGLLSTSFAILSFLNNNVTTQKNGKPYKGILRETGAGFTLIETIIYIALFTIVIGGGMVAAHQIVEGTNASYNHIILQEEANFLFRKIEWALTGLDGSSSITAPSTGTPNSDTDLVVNKDSTELTFNLADGNITLNGSPLNSSNIKVSTTTSTPPPYLFERLITPGKPDGIRMNFTLTTYQNGRPATQNFSFTKYLRH